VSRYVKSKTNPQLGLYFRNGGILDAWADYIGDDREGAHKDLKVEFLIPILEGPERTRVSRISGQEYEDIPSLADVSEKQMSQFLEKLIREGSQRGIEFDLRGDVS
jgi:hypothetical protein